MGSTHSTCDADDKRYDKLQNVFSPPTKYHLYTDEIIPVPDRWLTVFAERLEIEEERLRSMINTTDHDIVVEGKENVDEDFEIEHSFPIMPIMYDFEAKDAIMFIGTTFYAINSQQEIIRVRIIQPPGMAEARIERHFKRKLNFKKEVELKAWRNAAIILPDVKREDTLTSIETDIYIGQGGVVDDDYYIWSKKVPCKPSLCGPRMKKVPFFEDERLSINQFRGRRESYFQVPPFEKVKQPIDKSDIIINFRSRRPCKDWVLPTAHFMPTIGYPRTDSFVCWYIHYGPCTIICDHGDLSPANVMFLKSGICAQYWSEYTRDPNYENELEFYLSHC